MKHAPLPLATIPALVLAALVAAPIVTLLVSRPAPAGAQTPEAEAEIVQCANLIYGTPKKTSRCFGDKFLRNIREETHINAAESFTSVSLDSDDLFSYPFAVITGEGTFSFTERERGRLRRYIERGGFVLASAGCSDRQWADSFKKELDKTFPDRNVESIGTDHEVFKTIHDIREIRTKTGRVDAFKGIRVSGRLALLFTEEGLNDTGSVKGCCCCGGNEVANSLTINMNIFAYALTH